MAVHGNLDGVSDVNLTYRTYVAWLYVMLALRSRLPLCCRRKLLQHAPSLFLQH